MNDNIEILDSPWGENSIDLRGIQLTINQKLWLGQFMNGHEKGIRILKERYNLRKTSLYLYRQRYRDQVQMHSSGGRPRAIDSDSVEVIRDFVRSESPSKEQLKIVLKQAHVRTMCRRRPDIDAYEVRPLSKRSIGRYTVALCTLYDDDNSSSSD